MTSKGQLSGAAEGLKSDRAKFTLVVIFLAAVFLMGGGSRGDILSLPVLRPLCILFIAYALTVADPGQIRSIGVPLYLLAAMLVMIAVQLVPLPPAVWSTLPGRDLYAEVVAAAGLDGLWRPLSLSPARTLNSLLSLTAPLAALLLYAIQGARYRRLTWAAIAAFGLLSGIWGLLQLTGSSTGPLYTYQITNAGLPVGLFANRNHQAVLLGALIPVIAHFGLTGASLRGRASAGPVAALFAVLLLVATAVMTGSRAGLISVLIGLAASAAMVNARGRARSAAPGGAAASFPAGWIVPAVLMAVALAVAVVVWFGRALALERLFATDRIDDLRGEVAPILLDMVSAFFPVGAGFGAFDDVYDRFEPAAFLSDQYLNQAHNDWLQLLIEGGIPAALLLLIFLLWLGGQAPRMVRALKGRDEAGSGRQIAAFAFVATLGVASLFDYPLRVPSIMAVFAIACATLADKREAPGLKRNSKADGSGLRRG